LPALRYPLLRRKREEQAAMCDDFTASGEEQALARKGLSRREFAAMTAAAALAGCASRSLGATQTPLAESPVQITTADGIADAFLVHPAKGAWPGVIVWPDIAGLRETFKIMARGLAAEGYAVLVVNPYYRNAPAPVLTSFAEWQTPEGRARLQPMIAALTPEAVTRDAAAWVTYLDGLPAVQKTRKLGVSGYCMGGPFAIRTVAAAPQRVGAAATLHGANLVTDKPDSPHLLIGRTRASFLFAIARNDDQRDPEAKEALRKAAAQAGRPTEIEVYPADHGWCVPDTPVYDPLQADRVWRRMLALFAKL
jgi:carboxymethylenebutenolidase